jgi:SagB-type dehydrogenase family enzyme
VEVALRRPPRFNRRRVLKLLTGIAVASAGGGLGYVLGLGLRPGSSAAGLSGQQVEVELPKPRIKGGVSVEEALSKRRSKRDYYPTPLSLEELSTVLWAAHGVREDGGRPYPSVAGGYPLRVYVVAGARCVEGLEAGVYRYRPQTHSLELIRRGDARGELAVIAVNQRWVKEACVNFVVSGVGDERLLSMEVGFMAENIYLEATALGLGCTVIGAFHDELLKRLAAMEAGELPLYVIPLARPLW